MHGVEWGKIQRLPQRITYHYCREPSPAESGRARTSASSWKRSSELSAVPFMSLDLTPGHGNLLGESYWELISPYAGGAWTLNTGVSPRGARESSLSRILQGAPPTKYYLTPRACLGILRRAFERGKALPKKLERALKIQAGLALPDGQITDIDAYHINQRDEGIDLQGVSGALMATSNMQMQTFVTQASENTEGFDGYNGDLTGDVAATLGVNCGMSTGRNGVIAFAANQRDEVRDLHDVAGALNAQPGIKQQTFVAGFSAGAGASAGSIGYHESVAPTLKAGASGNCMPSVLCINDQGGQIMEISKGMTGTLRAQEHGHQPLVYKAHPTEQRQSDDYLFFTTHHGCKNRMSTDAVNLFMKKYGETARRACPEVPERVHPHQLRHSRAMHLYRAGMPLVLLSEFLGHADVNTTRIYAWADTEMKRQAIQKVSKATAEDSIEPIWANDEEMIKRLYGLA